MKLAFAVLFFLLLHSDISAQDSSHYIPKADTIAVKQGAFGYAYYFKGKPLTLKQLEKKLSKNYETNHILTDGKTSKVFAQIFSYAGGFLLGFSLGQLITSGKVNPYIVGAGAGCIGIAIPLSISYDKRLRKAVRIYNRSLPD